MNGEQTLQYQVSLGGKGSVKDCHGMALCDVEIEEQLDLGLKTHPERVDEDQRVGG